jgi:hypothetical protein
MSQQFHKRLTEPHLTDSNSIGDQLSIPPSKNTFVRIKLAEHFEDILEMAGMGQGAQREIEIGDLDNELASVRVQIVGYLKEPKLST